jgi:hypothetical protein
MLRKAIVRVTAECVIGFVCLCGVSHGQQESRLVGRTTTGTLEGDKGTNCIQLEFLSGGRVRARQSAAGGRTYEGTWSLHGNRISMEIGPSSFVGTLEGNRITSSRSRDDGIRESWKATLSYHGQEEAGKEFEKGCLFYDRGDFETAIACFTQAIRLNPDHARAYYRRGDAYDEQGDFDRAIADYHQAIRLDPDYAEAYCYRGPTYKKKGDYDRAIADTNDPGELTGYRLPAFDTRSRQLREARRRLKCYENRSTLRAPTVHTAEVSPRRTKSETAGAKKAGLTKAMEGGGTRRRAGRCGPQAPPTRRLESGR